MHFTQVDPQEKAVSETSRDPYHKTTHLLLVGHGLTYNDTELFQSGIGNVRVKLAELSLLAS